MKKITALTLVLVLLLTMAVGCASKPAAKTAVTIGTIQGPTGVGMTHLMQEDKNGTAANDYTFEVAAGPEAIRDKLTGGQLDIAALPTNVAAALYQKTNGNVRMLAVNTLGVLYILENGETVKSIADLKGKTIYSTGEGANPEYILRYVISQNGLNPDKDVTIKFLSDNDELSTKMATGDIKLAMVPEPAASVIRTKNTAVRTALSMNDEWDAVAGEGSKLMMGCVVVRKEFLENNKEAVDAFLTEYKASLEKAVNPKTTAPLCETYGIIPKAAIAEQAIPNCELTFVSGTAMKQQIAGYYNVLYSYNPKAIGGKLPDAKFYYVG